MQHDYASNADAALDLPFQRRVREGHSIGRTPHSYSYAREELKRLVLHEESRGALRRQLLSVRCGRAARLFFPPFLIVSKPNITAEHVTAATIPRV